MNAALGFLALLLHLALMLAAAPILLGAIRKLKARLLARTGPPIIQPWRDLARLARKQPVLAENASWLFSAAPAAAFTATLAAAALVPSFALGMTTAPLADLLVIGGLLALARVILALAGVVVGTAFGGIGSSREMMYASFAEPALVLVIFTLALLAGGTNLDAIAGLLMGGGQGLRVSLALALPSSCLRCSEAFSSSFLAPATCLSESVRIFWIASRCAGLSDRSPRFESASSTSSSSPISGGDGRSLSSSSS